jgi:hypothetical protein
MDIVAEPELYSPSLDMVGNYIDVIPSFRNGIRCPCGCRKDKIYENSSVFATHTKSKTHQKWLSTVNLNKSNYYIENERLKETLQNQRLIIAKLDKDLQHKNMTIDYLTQQLCGNKPNQIVTDLITFD